MYNELGECFDLWQKRLREQHADPLKIQELMRQHNPVHKHPIIKTRRVTVIRIIKLSAEPEIRLLAILPLAGSALQVLIKK
jgi:hypothetical protein